LPVGLVQLEHRREHRPVLLAVEVLGTQMLLDQQRVEVALVEQHRAQHRLLGLEVVWGDGDVLNGAHRRRPSLGLAEAAGTIRSRYEQEVRVKGRVTLRSGSRPSPRCAPGWVGWWSEELHCSAC